MQERGGGLNRDSDGRAATPSVVEPLELVGQRSLQRPAYESDDGRAVRDFPRGAPVRDGQRPNPEQALLEEATAWIRTKIAETVKLGALQVGEYVLARFFGNDPQLVKSKDPNKSASFRALAAKCGTAELPISKTWLNNAVRIALMTRILPEGARAFRSLPPSFQESLLPISDPGKVEHLARQAAARGLTFRKLRQLVAEEQAAEGARSRAKPSLPRLLKTMERSVNLLEGSRGEPSTFAAALQALDDGQRDHAAQRIDLLVRRLRKLALALRRAP